MGPRPFAVNAALILENGLEPKNFFMDNGEGCAPSMTTWRGSTSFAFFFAKAPQRQKTTGEVPALTLAMTASVNVSQPLSLCDAGSCATTVNTVLRSRTPCSAHA